MQKLFNTVLVTGGAGYCGSRLVPQLLEQRIQGDGLRHMYFGDDFCRKQSQSAGDRRRYPRYREACRAVQDMTRSSAWPAFRTMPASSSTKSCRPRSIWMRSSRWCSPPKSAGVKRFIYASSSSVYGVSDKPDVTEDHPLVPLTLYNKYKGMCEPLLRKHTDDGFIGVIFRPATVCGYAPRQRLDLSVNILTNHAVNANKITVFGGSQLRPNLHVQDYCDVVKLF